MSDLEIKITGDNEDLKKKINEIKSETEGLENKLSTAAKISGVAFAALNGIVATSVSAFAESQKASKELNVALQNQGIYTEELASSYQKFAKEVQKKTGIDDDALVASQAILQSFIGMTEVTPELTEAIADLSIKTGSTASAAEILGRAYQGNVRGLKQFGIEIDENLSQQERLNQILEKTSQKFGGLAADANSGLGGVKGLKDAFSSVAEEIGQRFAPAFEAAIKAKTEFLRDLANNPALLDFIANSIKIGLVITGVVTALATGALAVVKITQALKIASAAMEILGISTRAAVGATGLGLILIIAAEIYLNWNRIFPAMVAIYQTFATNISKIGENLGKILYAVFIPGASSLSLIKEGLAGLKSVVSDGVQAVAESQKGIGEETAKVEIKQNSEKKQRAIEANADVLQQEQVKRDIINASNELLVLQEQGASDKRINLKKAEIELFKSLEKANQDAQIESLNRQITENARLQEEAGNEAIEKERILRDTILANDAAYNALTAAQKDVYLKERKKQLEESINTEAQTQKINTDKSIQEEIAKNNKLLEEKKKYGAAYAQINQTLGSSELSGASQAANALATLQNSKNNELKAIGKAGAITQIGINTAKGAAAAYTGFLAAIPFPPVAIPLGIAAAAAIVAYGGEQIAKVVSAADGGVIPGFNRGGDSVNAFLQPGELVVPRANFSEVVNAVANTRTSQSVAATSGISTPGGGSSNVAVELQFSGDNAEKFLTARQVESRSLGTLRESTA